MITPKGYYCDVATREQYPILIMSAWEVLEREQLNIQNTASAQRRRVLEYHSEHNGSVE